MRDRVRHSRGARDILVHDYGDMEAIAIDETVLDDPEAEEARSFEVYLQATSHLANVLGTHRRSQDWALADQVESVLRFVHAPAVARTQDTVENAVIDLHFFGTVGKALYLLRDQLDPQMWRELRRFMDDKDAIVSNLYLFYIAGALAARGYAVRFIPEAGGAHAKTPDLSARKGGDEVFVEATTRQPRVPVDSLERLRRAIRGVLEEKRGKFAETRFQPGVIVADISQLDYEMNSSGTSPVVRMIGGLTRQLPNGTRVYPLYDDPDFFSLPENRGNLLAFVIAEFWAMGPDSGVAQCLITDTRRVVKKPDGIEFPKRHQLVVDRQHEALALTELAKTVFVVDRRQALPDVG